MLAPICVTTFTYVLLFLLVCFCSHLCAISPCYASLLAFDYMSVILFLFVCGYSHLRPWLFSPMCGCFSFVATPRLALFLAHCFSPPIVTLVATIHFSKVPLVPLVIVIPTCPLLVFACVSLDGIPSPCLCLL